jgi:hypothetical protein
MTIFFHHHVICFGSIGNLLCHPVLWCRRAEASRAKKWVYMYVTVAIPSTSFRCPSHFSLYSNQTFTYTASSFSQHLLIAANRSLSVRYDTTSSSIISQPCLKAATRLPGLPSLARPYSRVWNVTDCISDSINTVG